MSSTSQVYRAESMVWDVLGTQHEVPTVQLCGSTITVPLERRWADLQSLQQYVSTLAPTVRIRPRRGTTKATYDPISDTIAIPTQRSATDRTPWAMRQLVVLHEVAHALTRWEPDPHGPLFRQKYLDLTAQEMGPEAEFLLRVSFLENGVPLH